MLALLRVAEQLRARVRGALVQLCPWDTIAVHSKFVRDYRRMSFAEKRAHDRGLMRDRGVRCPSCDVETAVPDLLSHMEQRCPGPPEPSHAALWLARREAHALGVTAAMLHRLVASGVVQWRGTTRNRQYHARDLVLALAWRRWLSHPRKQLSRPRETV